MICIQQEGTKLPGSHKCGCYAKTLSFFSGIIRCVVQDVVWSHTARVLALLLDVVVVGRMWLSLYRSSVWLRFSERQSFLIWLCIEFLMRRNKEFNRFVSFFENVFKLLSSLYLNTASQLNWYTALIAAPRPSCTVIQNDFRVSSKCQCLSVAISI